MSVLQAGCFFGAIAACPLTDVFGRKWCLVGAALLTLVGVALQAAASGHIGAIYAGRAVAGLGVGGASVINPIYVTENAPYSARRDAENSYGFAHFAVDPGARRGGVTTMTVTYYAVHGPYGELVEIDAFTLRRPRRDG